MIEDAERDDIIMVFKDLKAAEPVRKEDVLKVTMAYNTFLH